LYLQYKIHNTHAIQKNLQELIFICKVEHLEHLDISLGLFPLVILNFGFNRSVTIFIYILENKKKYQKIRRYMPCSQNS